MGGVNEVLAVYLMAAKQVGGPVVQYYVTYISCGVRASPCVLTLEAWVCATWFRTSRPGTTSRSPGPRRTGSWSGSTISITTLSILQVSRTQGRSQIFFMQSRQKIDKDRQNQTVLTRSDYVSFPVYFVPLELKIYTIYNSESDCVCSTFCS